MRFRFFTFSNVYDYLELAPAAILSFLVVFLSIYFIIIGISPSEVFTSIISLIMFYLFMFFLIFIIIYNSISFFIRYSKVRYKKREINNINNEKYVISEIKNNSSLFHKYNKDYIFNGNYINFINLIDSRNTYSYSRNKSVTTKRFFEFVFSKHRSYYRSGLLIGHYSIIVINLKDIEYIETSYNELGMNDLTIKFFNNDYLYHFCLGIYQENNYLQDVYDNLLDNEDKYNYNIT